MNSPESLEEPMKKFLLLSAAMLMAVSPAFAIDFTTPITNMDGSAVTGADGKALDKPPTLGSICESALLAVYADEREPQTGKDLITPQEKYDRWKLAGKVQGKDVQLSAEELSKLKMLIGKGYAPLIVGQAWTLLDPGAK